MKYTHEICTDNKIISVSVSGELYTSEVVLMDKVIRLKANELNCKIVYDFRKAINRISITDAYYWFASDCDLVLFNLIHIPVVTIARELDEPFFDFFELTSNNKGSRIKNCKDEIAAFQWLEQF